MKGDEKNWWSKETLEAFKRRTACLKEQYSNFTLNGGQVREQTIIRYVNLTIQLFMMLFSRLMVSKLYQRI